MNDGEPGLRTISVLICTAAMHRLLLIGHEKTNCFLQGIKKVNTDTDGAFLSRTAVENRPVYY